MQDICQIGQAEAMPQSSGPGDEPITHLTYWAKPLALSSKAVGKTALARRNKCTARYASGPAVGCRLVRLTSWGAQMVGWQDDQASLGFLPPTNIAGHHQGTASADHSATGTVGRRDKPRKQAMAVERQGVRTQPPDSLPLPCVGVRIRNRSGPKTVTFVDGFDMI